MNYNSRKPRNSFTKMTIELFSLDTDKFDCDELIGLLEEIRFDLININLTTSKLNLDERARGGFVPIGFVNKFYTNEEGTYVFDIAISTRYNDLINEMTATSDIGITGRVFTNKEGKITKIIGLDLTPFGK